MIRAVISDVRKKTVHLFFCFDEGVLFKCGKEAVRLNGANMVSDLSHSG